MLLKNNSIFQIRKLNTKYTIDIDICNTSSFQKYTNFQKLRYKMFPKLTITKMALNF